MYYGYLGNTRKVVFCQSTCEYFSKLCHIKKVSILYSELKAENVFQHPKTGRRGTTELI